MPWSLKNQQFLLKLILSHTASCGPVLTSSLANALANLCHAPSPLPAAPAKRILWGMKRSMLLDHLVQVERHVREGESHLLRQREIVDELERHGRGNSETAKMA